MFDSSHRPCFWLRVEVAGGQDSAGYLIREVGPVVGAGVDPLLNRGCPVGREILSYTIHGAGLGHCPSLLRYLYAIGHNEAGALYSGIDVGRYKRLAYLLCAALAGVTGILYAPYLASVQPSFGTAFELYAIAAAVLGGCSLRGGEGAVLGVIVGATLMRLIGNGINLLGISTYWEFTVIGMVILLAAVLDSIMTKNAAGRAAA